MNTLPEWAEDVLRRFGPHPAFGADKPDPAAMARYTAMTERFRRRWAAELAPDVWSLFASGVEHLQQRQHLLGMMIDLARFGSRTEMQAKRTALDDVARVEDELRELLVAVEKKLARRAMLLDEHLIEGGFDEDLVRTLDAIPCSSRLPSWNAAMHALRQALPDNEEHPTLLDMLKAWSIRSWAEPRLHSSDYMEAINSRKSAADALNAMLLTLERFERLLLPVKLSDKARACVFNVSHDTSKNEGYDAAAIKTARARLRAR